MGGLTVKSKALLSIPLEQRTTIINLVRRSNARILTGGCCIFNITDIEPTLIFNRFQDLTDGLASFIPNCQVYNCPPNATFTLDLLFYPPTPSNNPILTDFADLVFDNNGVGTFNINNPNYSSANPQQGYQFRINNYGGTQCDGNCFSEVFVLLN